MPIWNQLILLVLSRADKGSFPLVSMTDRNETVKVLCKSSFVNTVALLRVSKAAGTRGRAVFNHDSIEGTVVNTSSKATVLLGHNEKN